MAATRPGGDRWSIGRPRLLGLVGALAIAVAIGAPPSTQAQDRVPWPIYRETKETKFNPYAPVGAYRGSAVQPRRCEIVGTGDRDLLRGTHGADVICARGGDDVIRGRGGDDTIDGGTGDDRIGGESGSDVLVGVAGDDSITGGPGEDAEFGGSGADRIAGGSELDRIYASSGEDTVGAGPGPDAIVGEPGADRLSGGGGDDTLVAQDASSDRVDGGPGTNVAIADLASRLSARGLRTADRLNRIQSTDPPPLAVGQQCGNYALDTWVSCQGTGQFGDVIQNSFVEFDNSGHYLGSLDYIGLHGWDDNVFLELQPTTVGLGAGHWGSDDELWLKTEQCFYPLNSSNCQEDFYSLVDVMSIQRE